MARHPRPAITAIADCDLGTGTVAFVWTPTPPALLFYAIAVHADEREVHIREVQRYAATLPGNSYGKQNRQHITARQTRIATSLRAIERAYHTATERQAQPAQLEIATARSPSEHHLRLKRT